MPPPPGYTLGSAGPTASYRMDAYAPKLYSLGVKASIGKERRSEPVTEAMKTYGAVYFGATGGADAFYASCVRESRIVAFSEMGPEALREMLVESLPLVVINDSRDGELYVEPQLAKAKVL